MGAHKTGVPICNPNFIALRLQKRLVKIEELPNLTYVDNPQRALGISHYCLRASKMLPKIKFLFLRENYNFDS